VLEFLAGDTQAHVVHSGAAVLLRHRDPQESKPGHASKNAIAVEAMMPVVFLDVRRDLTRGPLSNRLLEQLLFICQVEADHMSPESYHALWRSCTTAPRPRPSIAVALPPLTAISSRSELPTSAHNSPGVASAYVATIRGINCEPISTVTVPEIFPSVAASMFVVRFPKQSTRSTSPSTPASDRRGRGTSSLMSEEAGRP